MIGRIKQIGIIHALIAISSMSPAYADVPITRGRQILLDRGLQIQALAFFDQPEVNNIDIGRFQSANFTAINLWENQNPNLRAQLPANFSWGRQYVPGLPGTPSTYLYTEEMPYASHLVSLQYADEIQSFTPQTLTDISTAFRYWNAHYPNTLAHTNFGGPTGYISGAELTNFINVTKPDMISFDVYPHRYGSTLSNWYSAMQSYRAAALAGFTTDAGINSGPLPYAQFLYTALGSVDTPLPTASYIRLQQNASWAFGYTFVNLFTYNSYNQTDVPAAMFTGMGDSAPTPVYDYVKETNRQSLNLGPSLVRLVSTDVRFVTGRHPNGNVFDSDGDANPLPGGLTQGSAGTGWGHPFITNVSATNLGNINQQSYLFSDHSLPGDVIMGFFKTLQGSDASDEAYFMIVNGLTEEDGATAGDSHQRITINFDFGISGITSLQRLSRQTGQVELVPLIHDGGSVYHLNLTLDGGEGDLFKFNTGTMFVPEPAMSALGLLALTAMRRRERC